MFGARKMKWGGATAALAVIASSLVFGAVVPTAAVAAPIGGGSVAPMVAGQPGVPSAPTVLYQENFENGVGGTPVLLTNYVGATGVTYTANTPWLQNCNGAVLRFTSPNADQFGPAINNCEPASLADYSQFTRDIAYLRLRELSWGLGSLSGAADPALNHSVAAYTHGANPGAGLLQLRTNSPIPLPSANGRFVTFSVDSAAVNCAASAPQHQFSLVRPDNSELPVGGTINACQGGTVISVPTAGGGGGTGTIPVTAKTSSSNGSVLFNGASLGVALRNANGSGNGNDAAFDNIRILDATPQLDKSFSPTSVPVGGTSTLTFTVTNTSELAAKSGWSFTDTLPAGLIVDDPAAVGGTCNATTTAAAGATAISIANGVLNAGQVSCTVTVNVTSSTPAPNEPSPKTYTNCAANITAVVGLNLPNCASVSFFSEPELEIAKTSTATADSRAGDVVEYTVTATNTGTQDYTAANPAVVFDDLSGVLDDATYDNNAESDRGSAPAYAAPLLSWSGALAAGDTVTLTYSATLTADGDGIARNVAWIPNDPANPQPPACNPPVDGTDPTTGEPCAFTSVPLPRLSIDKSADRTELPAEGEQVAYTVVVTNEGPGAYTAAAPATATDDLSEVLDDATFDDASLSSDVGTVARDGDTLSWSGALAAGASATITYTVTYTGDGDNVLRNQACVPEGDALPGVLPCDTVRIPGAALQQWKTANPSSNPVVAGSTITYTLFFDNDGQAAADIDAVDNLTHVLDDAVITTEPTSADGLTVVRTGEEIAITGSVPAGERYTVTYTVTVLPDAERGDSIASNFLLAPGDTPPTDPECDPTDADFPDCTTTPISGAEYTKSVSASETPVVEGTELTYTVTVRNTGATVVDVIRDDDLTDVLDDATLTEGPESDTDSVTVDGPAANILAIRGDLAVGATATITYTVMVNAADERGNNTANNFLVPPGGTPPATCDPATEQCTSTPIQAYTVSKTADLAVANPGSTVTYTVTVTNTGTVAFTDDDPATFTDDLSEVLDDATYNGDITAGGSVDGDTLTWSGVLAVGATATVTYSVTVNDPATGDNVLTNAVVPTTAGGECDPEAECVVETPVASFTVEKTADVTGALPGDVVTYTVTVTNTGESAYTADAPASFTDDLSAVLDDATYNGDVSTGGSVTDTTLTWAGALGVDETVEVTYSVTVNDPITGDRNLLNTVVPAAPGGSCAPEAECSTTTPVGSYTVSKEANATTAQPGDVVTYTVTVANTGDVDYTDDAPASFSDDLSGVLDDAVYNDDVSDGGSVTGTTLTWSGALAAGDSVEVTYSVTIDSPVTGDFVLRNTVTPTGPGGSCTAEGDCQTETPIEALRVVKSADATDVIPGETVTYTITVTNTGQVAYTDAAPAAFTDDLSEVLDDATYNGDAASSTGAGVAYAAPVLSWSGPLGVGETVTVTYSVLINDPATGDQQLDNAVVTPPGVGGNCEPGSTDPACVENIPSGSFTVEKSTDPATAAPGDTVTYVVTVTNTGDVAYTEDEPASFSDDLSRVLDDATYNDDVSSGGSVDGTTLTWSGALAVGETLQVTYTVTVNDPVEGDFNLRNVVAPTAPGGECVDGGCITDTPVQAYTVSKTADVAVANPGSTVTYTVTLTNTGAVAFTDEAPASFTDDLSEVLDDATYNGDVAAGGSVDGDTLTWAGALPLGGTVTVTYSVTVNDPATGDNVLTNAVVPTTSGGECDPEAECVVETPVASFTVEKTADVTGALPGDVVTYTVTVTNTGEVDYTAEAPASFTDDLSAVLDDAAYNGDVSTGGSVTDATLTWSGALEVGETVEVTYSVTVNDPVTGDRSLLNTVVPAAPGGSCAPGADCSTTTPVGAYTVDKSASATTALPGDTVTYTVTVANTGGVGYTDESPASFSDDLSGVLDDAVYNDDATEGATVTGTTLTWSGALPAGETVEITYSVTIDSPVTGDFVLRNTVVPTGPGGSCTAEGECATETPVSALRVVKTADAVDVIPGETVTYTVTVTNTGQVAYTDAAPAAFTDDLSAVLDDATYNGDATSSTGAGVAYAAPVLSWSGPLAVGDTVTVTYSVEVNDPATGDQQLDNAVVTPPGIGGNCEPGSTDPACVENIPSGSFTVEKAVSSTTALPGDIVTYVVTVTNTGQIAYTDDEPASFSDDLSRVLDDATYNDDVSPGGSVDGTTLTWSGALAVGESLQVTYTVTVNDPVAGDFNLRNVVAPTAPGGECIDGGCITDTPIAGYTVDKSSNVTETVLGGVVTYAITVTNIGEVDYTDASPATFTDDLSGVLDDASYNDDASEGATVSGDTLDWAGALPVGDVVTVTYSVTVNDPATGDQLLRNAVLADGPGGGCAAEGDCVTETPVASLRVIKTVSTEQASVGDRITFTITVSNTGQVPYTAERPASFTDDLTATLALATYNNDATNGATYSAPVLSWEGELGVGDVRAITYSVTATKAGEIRNIVVTPDGSGANCSAESTDPNCVAITRVVPPGLAITGGQMWTAGALGSAGLIALGLWLVVRRRRESAVVPTTEV